jgi:two-component system, NarL family, nitrate/nitrite response regulator NarL
MNEAGVMIVQDHALLASSIAELLQDHPDLTVRGIARTGGAAALLAAREQVSVVVIDSHLPDMTGPAAVAVIREAAPTATFVFHSMDSSEAAQLDAIDAGASAFLTKSATGDHLVDSVRRAALGEIQISASQFARALARRRTAISARRENDRLRAEFTPREFQVLRLLAAGHGTAAMSKLLGIGHNTVVWHVRNLISKMQVHSQLQAVIVAARHGLVEL